MQGSQRQPTAGDGERAAGIALSIIAHIAVLAENKELADGVAEVFLARARSYESSDPIFEIVARLVECSSAIGDAEVSRASLVKRLEALSFTLPASEIMGGLRAAIQRLIRVQPALGPLLGKAIAAVRLGYPRKLAS